MCETPHGDVILPGAPRLGDARPAGISREVLLLLRELVLLLLISTFCHLEKLRFLLSFLTVCSSGSKWMDFMTRCTVLLPFV